MDDHELVRNYALHQSQDAFRQLVERHLSMVYSTAQRVVRDGRLAEVVAQKVFITLAHKAESIRPAQVVSGWLYNTTRHVALDKDRTEHRTKVRKIPLAESAPCNAHHINEFLEPAMAELDQSERDALVVRYLEGRVLREVGEELGLSEETARLRVNGALEHLRSQFESRGVSASLVALAAFISPSPISAVPLGLATRITAAALAEMGLGGLTQVTAKSWLKWKTAAAMAGIALLAGGAGYLLGQMNARQLAAENRVVRESNEHLTAERASLLASIRSRAQELDRLRAESGELARLRNEVSQLRKQTNTKPQLEPGVAQAARKIAPPKKGRFITREQLVFAGYETPEAALQSTTWAMISGDYDSFFETLDPEMRPDEVSNPQAREEFEERQQVVAEAFKGFQIVAKKSLSDDRVELKVKQVYDPTPNLPTPPEFTIQPMARVGSEWKISGSTREYRSDWENGGQVQGLNP